MRGAPTKIHIDTMTIKLNIKFNSRIAISKFDTQTFHELSIMMIDSRTQTRIHVLRECSA